MRPTVTALDGSGFEIFDPIENARFVLQTPESVEPIAVSTERFTPPVEVAVRVRVARLRIPERTSLYVHPDSGTPIQFDPTDDPLSLEEPATLEVNSAPTKLYLTVSKPVTIQCDGESVLLDVESEASVTVGVRSLHERPAGTVTTTGDPEGAMRALSTFGSALKTTSPERSFPTLRGHPPLVEVGDEFDVPAGIECPDTGIRIELPPEYEYVYPASSLAYYLGAEVVPADHPRLVTDEGFEYDLDGPLGYERTVGRVLRQTFLLDCVTRTEGYYQEALHEREQVEQVVDLDFEALYDQSIAERLDVYLSVSFETIEDHVTAWPLTVDVEPKLDSLEAIPFVAADLAVVRRTPDRGPPAPTPQAIVDFQRSEPLSDSDSEDNGVTPEPVEFETVGHGWVADSTPVGANELTVDSFRRSIDADAESDQLGIHVVCNDAQMRAEGVVSDYYQLNERHRFEVTVHEDLPTDELRDLLSRPADFLHYIGHIDDDGIVCSDGHLDARSLTDVRAKAFLLNACYSHEQGMALVEAGSLGGIITLFDVGDAVATTAGVEIARLLAAGYTLRASVSVLEERLSSGSRWTTVGNGGIAVCQSESGNPLYLRVERLDDETFRTEVRAYVSPSHGLGSAVALYLGSDTRYLVSGELDTLDLSESDLDEILDENLLPVDFRGERFWSDEISASDLR